MDAWWLLLAASPMVCYVLILAWFSLLARRLRLPVAAFTALVGTALGAFWQWFWGHFTDLATLAFNPLPTVAGYRLAAAAPKWFLREVPNAAWSSNPWQPTTVQVDRTPWVLLYPWDSVILSGLLWGLVGLTVGMVAARRWARA